MTTIVAQEDFGASADAVWKRLGDFGGIADWMPGVEKCEVEGEGVGALRSISMGPMTIAERLVTYDAAARTLAYSIEGGPLPVKDYLATIRVSETGPDSCHVDWDARFELNEGIPADAIAPGLERAYGGALKALKKLLG